MVLASVAGHQTFGGRNDNHATATLNDWDFLGVDVEAAARLAQADDFGNAGIAVFVVNVDCQRLANRCVANS